jgi:hypothetical protein
MNEADEQDEDVKIKEQNKWKDGRILFDPPFGEDASRVISQEMLVR